MARATYCRAALILAALMAACSAALAIPAADRVSILWDRARDQVAAGKPDAALASAERAVEIAPDDPDAAWLLGWVQVQRGESADAVRAFTRAVELAPDNAVFHGALGSLLLTQDQVSGAVEHLRKAVSLDPTYAQAFQTLGTALERAGWPDAAADCWRKVLTLDCGSGLAAQAHNGLGYYYSWKGEWKTALAEIRQALGFCPNEPDYLDSLGSLATLSGDLTNGERTLRRALATGAPLASSHAALAFCLARQGRPDDARAELGEALSDLALDGTETNGDLLFFAAKACAELGDTGKAQELAGAFLKVWPKLPWAAEMEKLAAGDADGPDQEAVQ